MVTAEPYTIMGLTLELLNTTQTAAQPQVLGFGIGIIIIAGAIYTSHSTVNVDQLMWMQTPMPS